MKTNKNGVKLLAAVMVFAMAFAAFAVIDSDVSAAESAESKTLYVDGTAKESGDGTTAVKAMKTIKEALDAGATIINISGNYVVTSTQDNIPSGVTVNVTSGKSLKVDAITWTVAGTLDYGTDTTACPDFGNSGYGLIKFTETAKYKAWNTQLISDKIALGTGATYTVGKVSAGADYTETISGGTVTMSGHTIETSTKVVVDSGAKLTLGGALTVKGTLTVNGTLVVNTAVTNAETGTLTVNGALKINDNGSITNSGTFTVANEGSIQFSAKDNTNALDFSRITSTGTFNMGGKYVGEGWSLSGTTLTLTNYNGKQYFDGAFQNVVLSGTNVIDLTKVKGTMGDGEVFAAIQTSAAKLDISGDALQIKITIEKGVTSFNGENASKIAGIYVGSSSAAVNITNKNLKIAISGDMIIDYATTNQAIYGVYSGKDLVVGSYTKEEGAAAVITPVAVDISVSPSSAYAFGFTGITKAQFTMTGSVEAGNRALFTSTKNTSAGTGMILKGCGTTSTPLVLIASEKAIQAKSSAMVVVGSNIDARISGNELYNHGNDDVWGIMAGTLDVDKDSTVKTEGLRINGTTGTTLTNAGIIIVSGDYQQNLLAVTKTSGSQPLVTIAGFYYDNEATSYTNVTEKAAEATKVYLTNGAQYYGLLTVDNKTTATVSSDLQTALNGNDTTVIFTGSALPATVEVPAGKTLQIGYGVASSSTSNTITINKGSEVQISNPAGNTPAGMSFTVKNAGVDGSQAVFDNIIGTFTITYGSIVIDSEEITSGSFTVPNGTTVKISGSVDGEFTINGPTGDGESATVLVQEGTSLDIGKDATLTLTGNIKMNNDGQVIGGGEIVVNKPAQFYTSNPVSVTFSGDGKIILEDATETLKLSDKLASSIIAEPTQKVIITGNLTIKENQYLIVNGDLEIPAGVTVTIENGGQLKLTSPTASANIAGNIKSMGTYNGEAGFTVDSFVVKDVIITGQITAGKTDDNDLSVSIAGYAYLDGTITVSSKAKASFGNLYVSESGTVTVKGTITGSIHNQGTVTMDGATNGTTTIYNQATTAVVQIDSLSAGILTVSDEGLYLKTDGTTRIYVPSTGTTAWGAEKNVMTFQNVKGVTITESIAYVTDNNVRNPYNHMIIAGALGISNTKEAPALPKATVVTGNVYVEEELSISKALLTIDGELIVNGTVYVDDSEITNVTFVPTPATIPLGIDGSGILSVNGLVRTIADEVNMADNKINAVKYEKKVDLKDVYYYTNLADAIASGEKELEVLGTQLIISKDTTIPAGIEIDATDAKVVIGKNDTSVTLTVVDGGYLGFSSVDVYGTFYIENTDDGVNKLNSITSDTSVISENTAMYTNLSKALATAESGEVKITKIGDQKVTLSSDATVKEGVTLVVPTSKILVIMNGVTLTVDGTLDLKGTLESVKATNADENNGFKTQPVFVDEPTKFYSVVKVNGTLVSAAPMDYDGITKYFIPGAYYEYKGKYFITTIDKAAEVVKTVDASKVDIYGENKIGAVAFEGTSIIPATINVHGNINAEALTVRFGTITFDDGVCIDGTFGSSVGTIVVSNMKIDTSALTITDTTVTVDDEEVQKVSMSGTIVTNKAANSASVKFSGAVEINGLLSINTTYSAGYGSNAVNEDSTVTVVNGGELKSAKVLTVNGTLIAQNSGKVSATTLIVNATLDIQEKSDRMPAAGVISVGNLYIGGSTSDVSTVSFTTSGTAVVNAPSSGVSVVYLFPGSTVTGGLSIALAKEDVKYTEFYVEDVLWLTVYNVAGVSNLNIVTKETSGEKVTYKYGFAPKTIKEKAFVSWQYVSSGKLTDFTDTTAVGAKEKVYADIKYDVYGITVYACEGIDDVFIDGNLMVYSQVIASASDGGAIIGLYSASVVAGEHTISYTLTNGYSGTATMYIDDEKVTGYKFTAGGDFGDGVEYSIKLQGIEKSGYVPESPDTPAPTEPTEDKGLGITEYLLIVLVVLAAILVVVVAIRMMRS